MKLFSTPKAIVAEIDQMDQAEFYRREDRATVSGFFNGEPPLTDEEAEDMGLTCNVNNLFGYTEVASAKTQLFSLYTKPTQLFSVELDACPAPVRQKWEMNSTRTGNDTVRGSGRLKPHYEGVSGDAGLHGTGIFFFPNATDWCPNQAALSRFAVPDDAPADPRQQTHWKIDGELTLRQAHQYLRLGCEGWNTANLQAKLSMVYDDVESSTVPIDWSDYNPEEIEYRRQSNAAGGNRRRPSIRVHYFYQVRSDLAAAPVSLTIILHKSEVDPRGGEKPTAESRVLYEGEAFDSIDACLHPFHMDCILGGVPMWHRIMGVGTLNYQLNHAVELLLNRSMQGTLEGMMNLWQAGDSANREDIQRILLRHNGVIPEGIKLVPERFKPDLSGSLQMIQFYRQQGSVNANRLQPNDGRDNVLQVQAMQEQDQIAQQVSSKTSNWYDCKDRLYTQIWARLTNPFIQPCDPGYSEIKKFQSRVERLGIPLYYLQPHNVKVSATRIVGDGNTQREQATAAFLTQNRSMYGPKAQQEITRIVTATATGSYELAERLVPDDDTPDKSQVRIAQGESSDAIVQGQPPQVDDTDIDEVHVPVHMQAMSGIVQKASQMQSAAFTPDQYLGFKALGAHVVMHIQKKESMVGQGRGDANKQMASQWMQQLNQIVSVGEKLAHNMQQQQQGGAKPDPTEVAKLQLSAQQLQLQMQKFEFSRDKWSRQQAHKEASTHFDQALKLQSDHRDEKLARAKVASTDVDSAVKIKQAHADANQPTE